METTFMKAVAESELEMTKKLKSKSDQDIKEQSTNLFNCFCDVGKNG